MTDKKYLSYEHFKKSYQIEEFSEVYLKRIILEWIENTENINQYGQYNEFLDISNLINIEIIEKKDQYLTVKVTFFEKNVIYFLFSVQKFSEILPSESFLTAKNKSIREYAKNII